MSQESYAQLWRSLRLYSSVLPVTLAQQYIKGRFRDIRRKRLWSWRIGQGQFITQPVYGTGLISVVQGSNVITGTGTNWTTSLVGMQFRVGTIAPIYTVVSVSSPTSLQIDKPYGGLNSPSTIYQILNAYITPTPSDFQDFISVKDPRMNWQLRLHVPQDYLDIVDAQRANNGTPYCLADLAYNATQIAAGSVTPIVQVSGTGSIPFAFGLYSGFTQSVYVITISAGGLSGQATFTWRKDNGSTTGPINTTGAPFAIDAGVSIQFPSGTYNTNDTFVIAVVPGYTASMPMFELWPYQLGARVYPYLYDRRFPDVDDPSWALPRYIDGDLLIKGALADLCRWKGTSDVANPMFSLDVANSYQREFEAKVSEMEREDDEVFQETVRYQIKMPYPDIFIPGADYMQTHEYGTFGG